MVTRARETLFKHDGLAVYLEVERKQSQETGSRKVRGGEDDHPIILVFSPI